MSKIRPYFLDFLDLKNKKLDLKTYFLAFIDLKTNFLAFLDLKNDCSSLYISEICLKSLFFGHISPNFFDDLFLVIPKIFSRLFFKHPQILFRLYRPKNCFLVLKIQFFIPKKNFF